MSAPDYARYSPEDSSCVHGGVHRCENVRAPRKCRIVFSIAFFEYPSPALLVFRLTKLRRTFYERIERASFRTAWTQSRRGTLPTSRRAGGHPRLPEVSYRLTV